MAVFGTSSGWAKWSFITMCVALILFIVGFSTMYWMQNDSTTVTSVGLWRLQTCTSGNCDSQSVPSDYKNDNFRATQAFEVMALLMFLCTPVLLGIYVFAAGSRTYNYAVFCMVMCFLTAALAMIGVFIWLAYIPRNFSVDWSCGLVIIAAILAIIAGLLLIPDLGWCSSYANSAILLFIGSVLWIFALGSDFSIGWSYGLTLIALILNIIAALLLVPEVQNFNYYYDTYDDEYDSYYEKKSRVSPTHYPRNSPRQPRYARDAGTPPSTSSTAASGRTSTTSISNVTMYDSKPQPMAVDNPSPKYLSVNAPNNSRPATFNDITNVRLQRDRVF